VLGHDPESLPADLIRGWKPVFGKIMLHTKKARP
jgi:hypothetical protein